MLAYKCKLAFEMLASSQAATQLAAQCHLHPSTLHLSVTYRVLRRYLVLYDTKPSLMKIWVPIVWFTTATLVVLIEVRIAVGFAGEAGDLTVEEVFQ